MFSPKKLAAAAEALGAVGDVPRDRDGKALIPPPVLVEPHEDHETIEADPQIKTFLREAIACVDKIDANVAALAGYVERIAALEDRLAKLEHLVHSQARVAAIQEQQMERNTRFSALQIVAQSRGAALGPEDLSLADAIIGWLKMMPTVG